MQLNKNSKKAPPDLLYRRNLFIVAITLLALFSVLLVQFFKIQIIEGEKWKKIAASQHQITVVEPAKRGAFYSNTSVKTGHPEKAQPFVFDVLKYHLYADPLAIPESFKEEVSDSLKTLLQLDRASSEHLKLQLGKKSRSRKIALWLEPSLKESIQKWWLAYAKKRKIARNALFFSEDYKRSYPFGNLLGQVLHTVREENDGKYSKVIPTGGLEMIFDPLLSGRPGKKKMLRSPRHPMEIGSILEQPEDGADVYLTINHYLQAVCEEETKKAVENARAQSGWAIMMDPYSGEVLALAQYPSFDPARYAAYFNDNKLKEHTKVKAVTDPFEPGSTMKPLTLAIAMLANQELAKMGKKPLFFPNEKIATSNGKFPGRSKPIKDLRMHKYLNMYLGLQKSSNIYMGRLIQRVIDTLGPEWYRKCLQDIFGFGVKTGIELPSESSGLLPTPGKKHPNGALEWSVPTPFSLAIGHNLLANSFQVVRAYGILANGGYDVKPKLIRKIVRHKRDGTEEIIRDNMQKDPSKPRRLIDAGIINELIKAMKFTTKPGGSAAKADIYGYTEVGKTGSSEKIVNGTYSKTNHISSFIGFTPAKNARFVLMVVIDEPEYRFIPGVGKNQLGGQCAAPAFREIASKALQYLGVEPDDPFGYPVGDPRRDPHKADYIEEAEELRRLYNEWNGS